MVPVHGKQIVERGRTLRRDPLHPEAVFIVYEELCENGLCVRHQCRDLFRFTAEFGTVVDNAVDVGDAVRVGHRLLEQPDFDDDQRVPRAIRYDVLWARQDPPAGLTAVISEGSKRRGRNP